MDTRSLLSGLARIVCETLTAGMAPRVIYDRAGMSPYLSRFYLLGGPRSKQEEVFDNRGSPVEGAVLEELPFNIYLHKFHRGDDDEALHNHPWKWSVSFILAGGYAEERRVPASEGLPPNKAWDTVERRLVLPFTFNIIRDNDFHRVDLLEEDAWSIFFAGPKTQNWGFWDRDTNKFWPWREFIFGLRQGTIREA